MDVVVLDAVNVELKGALTLKHVIFSPMQQLTMVLASM